MIWKIINKGCSDATISSVHMRAEMIDGIYVEYFQESQNFGRKPVLKDKIF